MRHEIPSPGYMIDRVRFDRDLARRAAFAGATVVSSARLVGRERDLWIVRHASGELRVQARFLIAADGPVSKVADVLGLNRLDLVKGIQAEVPLTKRLDKTLVFLSREMTGGYGWLFPKGLAANVGTGSRSGPGNQCRRAPGALIGMAQGPPHHRSREALQNRRSHSRFRHSGADRGGRHPLRG